MIIRPLLPLLAVPLLGLGACATTSSLPPTEVLRYHLPSAIERGTATVEAAQGALMSQPYQGAVARQLALNGFAPPNGGPSQLIAVVDVRRTDRPGPLRSSGFSIGLGGGSYGGGRSGGVGLGGGVNIPVGRARASTITATELSVLLKRRSDQTTVWEGHARTSVDARRPEANGLAADQATAEKLAAALFTGFPGESGRTIVVK